MNLRDGSQRRPKWAIRPRVQSDQVAMDYNDCANSDCDDPKKPRDLIMCAGLGCQTKVCATFAIGFWLMWWSLSFITHAYPPERKKETGSVMTYVVLIAASIVRSSIFKVIYYYFIIAKQFINSILPPNFLIWGEGGSVGLKWENWHRVLNSVGESPLVSEGRK